MTDEQFRERVSNALDDGLTQAASCDCGAFYLDHTVWTALEDAVMALIPTQEQIVKAISQAVGGYNQNTRTIQHTADAVLALIQNGADR